MSNLPDDPRRAKPIKIWWKGMIGRLFIDGESWGAIEWSAKRKAFCIEDAEGRCLSHHSHVHGSDRDKAGAVALAEAMIRDGRMPSPEQASKHREERLQHDRERRARQPSEIRRRQKREEEERRFHVLVEAESDDQEEPPLWEVVADALDFADPELWKSNSFARLRGRLIVALKAEIAEHEYRSARRGRLTEADQQQFARACEILALLTGVPIAEAVT